MNINDWKVIKSHKIIQLKVGLEFAFSLKLENFKCIALIKKNILMCHFRWITHTHTHIEGSVGKLLFF